MWRADAACAPAPRAAADAAEAIRLKVSAKRRIRAGRAATVAGRPPAPSSVVSWRVLLNGKRIKTLPGTKSQLRKKVSRPGTHRWKVVGLDAEGQGRLRAAQFKVLRSR